MNRTDRGRPNLSPRCEPMPTPGAAPRGRMAREPQEACRGRTARAAPDARSGHPDPPAAYDDALDSGLESLGLTLPASVRAAIDGHARLLLAWTEAINLTAIRDPAAVAVGHVIDSLTGLAVLRERGADRFIDLGSGGGYPGIPLAAAYPAARALLLEPVGKKARFLSVVAEATGLADDCGSRAGPGRGSRRRATAPGPLACGHRAGGGIAAGPRGTRLPAARAGRLPDRLEARRHRRGAGGGRAGASMRSVAGRSACATWPYRAWKATDWSSRPPAARCPPATRATRHAQAPALVILALLDWPCAHRRALGYPQQPRCVGRRPRPDRSRRCDLAPR